MVAHLRIGDPAKRRGGGDRDTGYGGKYCVTRYRCHGEPPGNKLESVINQIVQVARRTRFIDEVAEQHEQWDRCKYLRSQIHVSDASRALERDV